MPATSTNERPQVPFAKNIPAMKGTRRTAKGSGKNMGFLFITAALPPENNLTRFYYKNFHCL